MHELYDILHILGVVLFFGGMIVSLKWLFFAERRGQETMMRSAVKRTHQINMFVTAPGIIMITLSGFFQAPYVGGLFSQSWLIVGLALFALSVLLWVCFFIPAYYKLLRITANFSESLPPDFFTLLHRLYFLSSYCVTIRDDDTFNNKAGIMVILSYGKA